MNWIAELLPLFFARWYSRKYLETFNVGNCLFTNPRPGIYVRIYPDA